MKIIYDGHCPFCHEYVRLVRIRKVVGSVELIDLRVNRECLAGLLAEPGKADQLRNPVRRINSVGWINPVRRINSVGWISPDFS